MMIEFRSGDRLLGTKALGIYAKAVEAAIGEIGRASCRERV